MGSRAVHEITGTWLAASLLHQDPRYYPSPQREFGPRLKYAATRPLITRGDDGSTQFNTSNLIGTMASATAATAWHPHETDHTKKWFTRVGTGLALDSAWKVAREFIHVK